MTRVTRTEATNHDGTTYGRRATFTIYAGFEKPFDSRNGSRRFTHSRFGSARGSGQLGREFLNGQTQRRPRNGLFSFLIDVVFITRIDV